MRARERMFGALLAVAVALAASGCGGERAAPRGYERVAFQDLTADPAAYTGRRVRVTDGFWVSSFEQSVLTGALAESYPPQAVEPFIWVTAEAEGDCITSDEAVSWGKVIAEGTFRFDEDGGFGHLGVYTMELDDARLRCP
jgi:hypothetical protein